VIGGTPMGGTDGGGYNQFDGGEPASHREPVLGNRPMIEIIEGPIDHASLTDRVRCNRAGAVCTFLGTVREITGTRQTLWLDYEAYPEMALKKMQGLEEEARGRWPIIDLAMVHRVGRLDLGEISIVIAVSCPHRHDAFDACRWLIDTFKEVVPIWKRESWADGTEEWVHPGMSA
jgi:molybdopterin synthase catalytic subunit